MTSPIQSTTRTLLVRLAVWTLGIALLTGGFSKARAGGQPDSGLAAQAQAAGAVPAPPASAPDATVNGAGDHSNRAAAFAIPVTAIVLGIGLVLFCIWVDYRKRRDLLNICHQERMAALDKGLEPPPFPEGFLDDSERAAAGTKPASPYQGLKSGLVFLGAGVGLAIFLNFQEGRDVTPAVGAIPIGIGLARIVGFLVEKRRAEARSDGALTGPGR